MFMYVDVKLMHGSSCIESYACKNERKENHPPNTPPRTCFCSSPPQGCHIAAPQSPPFSVSHPFHLPHHLPGIGSKYFVRWAAASSSDGFRMLTKQLTHTPVHSWISASDVPAMSALLSFCRSDWILFEMCARLPVGEIQNGRRFTVGAAGEERSSSYMAPFARY